MSACHISSWLIAVLGMKLQPTSHPRFWYHSLARASVKQRGVSVACLWQELWMPGVAAPSVFGDEAQLATAMQSSARAHSGIFGSMRIEASKGSANGSPKSAECSVLQKQRLFAPNPPVGIARWPVSNATAAPPLAMLNSTTG